MEVFLKETERIDELNNRGYRIIQDKTGFCFGIDAVLLSSFAIINEGDLVLDLGTGTGVIPILLEAKTKGRHFTGLEIQESVCEMAKRSVLLNELSQRVEIIEGDLKKGTELFKKASFNVITSNPPYMKVTGGLVSPNQRKAISRSEIMCDLADVFKTAYELLVPNGRFYMVHRPDRLDDIMLLAKKQGFAVRLVRFVYPDVNKGATMVLIECLKGTKHSIILEKPCIIYESMGVYTQEINDIYYNEMLMEHKVLSR